MGNVLRIAIQVANLPASVVIFLTIGLPRAEAKRVDTNNQNVLASDDRLEVTKKNKVHNYRSKKYNETFHEVQQQ